MHFKRSGHVLIFSSSLLVRTRGTDADSFFSSWNSEKVVRRIFPWMLCHLLPFGRSAFFTCRIFSPALPLIITNTSKKKRLFLFTHDQRTTIKSVGNIYSFRFGCHQFFAPFFIKLENLDYFFLFHFFLSSGRLFIYLLEVPHLFSGMQMRSSHKIDGRLISSLHLPIRRRASYLMYLQCNYFQMELD